MKTILIYYLLLALSLSSLAIKDTIYIVTESDNDLIVAQEVINKMQHVYAPYNIVFKAQTYYNDIGCNITLYLYSGDILSFTEIDEDTEEKEETTITCVGLTEGNSIYLAVDYKYVGETLAHEIGHILGLDHYYTIGDVERAIPKGYMMHVSSPSYIVHPESDKVLREVIKSFFKKYNYHEIRFTHSNNVDFDELYLEQEKRNKQEINNILELLDK